MAVDAIASKSPVPLATDATVVVALNRPSET
jgi:hypothetical protein